MSLRNRDISKAVALLIVVCVMQIYVFAGATTSLSLTEAKMPPDPQVGATLKTTNNQPVTVNGNSVRPGTTVLSGSTIETPSGIAATLQLALATLEIQPEAELTIEFAADGNVKVTLKRGCVILKTRENANGTIITPDGAVVETGTKKRAEVCFPLRVGAAAAASGPNRTLLAVLIAGGAVGGVAAALLAGGANPSPSSP